MPLDGLRAPVAPRVSRLHARLKFQSNREFAGYGFEVRRPVRTQGSITFASTASSSCKFCFGNRCRLDGPDSTSDLRRNSTNWSTWKRAPLDAVALWFFFDPFFLWDLSLAASWLFAVAAFELEGLFYVHLGGKIQFSFSIVTSFECLSEGEGFLSECRCA